MNLINIYNRKNKICLFLRDKEGKLTIRWIKDFYPYYYELDKEGKHLGYDGKKLKKIIVNEPKEVPRLRSEDSYESDIIFTNRYIIDKIDTFDKTFIKWVMIDIEVQKPEGVFPDPDEAKYPVSCITIYNSKYDKIRTWFLGDYKGTTKEKEIRLFKDLIIYFRKAKFDLIIGYYLEGFDYPYLYNRFNKLPQKYFFNKI